MKSMYKLEEGGEDKVESWWKYLWKLANLGLHVLLNLMARGVHVNSEECIHRC